MTLLTPAPPASIPREVVEHVGTEVRRPFLLTTSARTSNQAESWPLHTHTEHELVWSDRGIVTMYSGGRRWTVTPGVGLWIPAGTPHEGSVGDKAAVRTTYFAPESWTRAWHEPIAVSLNPAVRQLLIHLRSARMTIEQRIRAQQVCMDLLQTADTVQLDVPVPRDPRLAPLVDAVLSDPADDRSLEQWASLLSMTSRTLTRAFSAEVAMSFARWRRLVRMRAAVGQLADGTSVKSVARRVGYGSTSAFVAAFHRTVGYTPGDVIEQL
ncbi:AraC family transcriptional regulator [Microbacterium sp. ZW T5_56]|uniref:helix-turn-helix transcriptional regulator n=1 Tax=Microbacterium sp. ZW T5_56 TaxID=3378081 RepID=UPI0038521BEF